ncbi:MAG: indole-3-glycerol phosphate synthase TrpC [Thermoanaerobaculia bacterium]
MNDVLEKIVARTRERLAVAPIDVEDVRFAARQQARRRKPRAFSAAFRADAVNIIAEIKSASPSAGSIVPDPNVEAIAADYARGGAAAISIVTEPEFFLGSCEWIARAKHSARLPVVMKDFIVESSQLMNAAAAGADAVLLLASLLSAKQIASFIELLDDFGMEALVEVHDEAELDRAIEAGSRIIGVNNRDLRTFKVDLATAEKLAERIPGKVIRIAESGIRNRQDIDRLRNAGFHAFLVGESLLRQNDRAAAVRSLVGGDE